MKRRTFLTVVGVSLAVASCGDDTTATVSSKELPDSIEAILAKPRYAKATWSLLVGDVETGETFYELNPDKMALTGSTRKLFSVGTALKTLGAQHRVTTRVHRVGDNLVLVGAGDLTFGGRRIDADTVQFTDFDHNDANSLGTAILTPQDPLYAVNQLAEQVRKSGITTVTDVVVDSRLFTPYRVPNGNLLITPTLVNENQVDVTVSPTQAGKPASVDYRPKTAALRVGGTVDTSPAGSPEEITLSNRGLADCIGSSDCSATVSGTLPQGYQAPLTNSATFVGTFRIEDPDAYARTAFIEALQRNGVTVTAGVVAPNPAALLPERSALSDATAVASFESPPFEQDARLVLKVSLNLGANLSLSLFGVEKGATTIDTALAAERQALIAEFGVNGDQFDFPTNGSGTPDSKAAPRALVALLTAMSKTEVAKDFQACLPIMGTDGSLAHTGTTFPGKGHVFAKPGTTIMAGDDGQTLELKAQNLAGYIETKSGRKVAYALMVNDAGPVNDIAADVGAVFEDEGEISSIIYETL